MHRNKQPCIQILRKRSNAKTKSYRLYRASLREQNPNDNSNVNRQTNDRSSFQKTAHRQIFQKNIYHDRGWVWKRQTGHLHKSNGRNYKRITTRPALPRHTDARSQRTGIFPYHR